MLLLGLTAKGLSIWDGNKYLYSIRKLLNIEIRKKSDNNRFTFVSITTYAKSRKESIEFSLSINCSLSMPN